jgi:hypothetical protein
MIMSCTQLLYSSFRNKKVHDRQSASQQLLAYLGRTIEDTIKG